MSESRTHKSVKKKAAEQTEVKILKNRRLDSAVPKRATEVEFSGNFKVAVSRLKASGRLQKILITRFKEIPEAEKTEI